jgi:hypothetical protein
MEKVTCSRRGVKVKLTLHPPKSQTLSHLGCQKYGLADIYHLFRDLVHLGVHE